MSPRDAVLTQHVFSRTRAICRAARTGRCSRTSRSSSGSTTSRSSTKVSTQPWPFDIHGGKLLPAEMPNLPTPQGWGAQAQGPAGQSAPAPVPPPPTGWGRSPSPRRRAAAWLPCRAAAGSPQAFRQALQRGRNGRGPTCRAARDVASLPRRRWLDRAVQPVDGRDELDRQLPRRTWGCHRRDRGGTNFGGT